MLASDIFFYSKLSHVEFTNLEGSKQGPLNIVKLSCLHLQELSAVIAIFSQSDLKQKNIPRLHKYNFVAIEDIQMRSGKIIELSDLTKNIANCSEIQNTNVSENLRCGDIKCCKNQLTYFGLIDGNMKR